MTKPEGEGHLVDYIRTMKHAYGTDVFVHVVEGSLNSDRKKEIKDRHVYLDNEGGFLETLCAPDLRTGAQTMMQVGGLGRLRPNTLVMGFPEHWHEGNIVDVEDRCAMYQGMMYDAITMDYGFMLTRNLENAFTSDYTDQPRDLRGAVDVWWLLDSGGLELLIPHIMSLDSFWKRRTRGVGQCPVRLLLVSAQNIANQDEQDLDDLQRLGAGNVGTLAEPEDMWATEIKLLLKKLRMNWFGPIEIKSNRDEPTDETKESFRSLCGLNEREELDRKTLRWLRVSELIYAYSKREAAVFVTAPYPDPEGDPVKYMGIMDLVSNAPTGPVTLIRGCERNCVTIHQD